MANYGTSTNGVQNLMDITTQAEVLLRVAGYETWTWAGSNPAVICFENSALIGFVHFFPSANELLERWHEAQNNVLAPHSHALRAAGAKAWNVYSVFLTEEKEPILQREIERIEEDFSLTRKIARSGVRTHEELERALLPLSVVHSQPLISESDFEDRLRLRLKDVPPEVMVAFLSSTSADDVARILVEAL